MSQTPSSFTPTPYTPSGDASFTPTQGTYKELKPFRYWCQKVLPLVYDDSLSYYELLCKVVDYLNKTMEDVDTLHDDVDNLHTAYTQLENDMNGKYHSMTQWMNSSYTDLVNFVNTYFANLDVQTEINNKLDAMASDGTLSTLIEPYVQPKVNNKINSMVSSGEFADIVSPFVPPAVNTKVNSMVSDGSFKAITDPKVVQETDTWLGQHITNPSNPPLDTSLSLANAAAPAKTVGDKFATTIINHGAITTGLTDADNIAENCVVFNSKNEGVMEISNTPAYAGWLETIIATSSLKLQLYYPASGADYIQYRVDYLGTWQAWRNIPRQVETPRQLVAINSGDLNDYTDSTFLMLLSPNTIQNLPLTGAGLVNVYNYGDGVSLQIYTHFTDTSRVYTRRKAGGTWSDWTFVGKKELDDYMTKVVVDYGYNPVSITDANNVAVNSMCFNSKEGGVYGIANTPDFTGWLQTNILSASLKMQIYYPSTVSNNIYYRTYYLGTWQEWTAYAKQTAITTLQSKVVVNHGADSTGLTNANNITENSIVFNSKNGSVMEISNTPAYAGWLETNKGTNNLILQLYYPASGADYIQHRVNYLGTWQEWQPAAKRNETPRQLAAIDTGDINDYTSNVFLIVLSPNDVAHLPLTGAGFINVFNYGGIILQVYTHFSDTSRVYTRKKLGDTWSDWLPITNTYTKNITQNTITNTYNITTSPVITTDTNGWLQAIDNESTSEASATDMTGAIMSMLNDTGYCHLGEGVFFVSGNITLPENSTLVGCGEKTIIKLLNSVTNGYIARLHTHSTIKDIRFTGNFTDISIDSGNIGGRTGIAYIGNADGHESSITPTRTQKCTIMNCWFDNLDNAIYGHNSNGNQDGGLVVTDVFIRNCNAGINLDYLSEYHKFTNIIITHCYYACINNGGNNVFIGCNFHGTIGFLIDNSNNDKENNTHGACVGCTFNHINNWNNPSQLGSGLAIKIINGNYGFIFANCQIWYGSIYIENTRGIEFIGTHFGGAYNTYTIIGTLPNFFNGCIFMNEPDLSNVSNTTHFIGCFNGNNGNAIGS